MYEVIDEYTYYVFENIESNNNHYRDITNEWLKKANTSVAGFGDAKYVIKNGKRYYVNNTNKIVHKNNEIENAKWYVNLMGGKIIYLPTINENGGIQCSDYKYYPPNSKRWYYLEEKETHGKSKNVFYHALENKLDQAEIFLIDCTQSNFSDDEISQRLNVVFNSLKYRNVIVIIKRKDALFGVFKKRD